MTMVGAFFDDLLDRTVVLGYSRLGLAVRQQLWRAPELPAGAENHLDRQREALHTDAPLHALWQLNNTTGANGVEVDDSMHPRAAVGLSLFWTTPIGPLRMNFSKAVEKQDYDEVQNFDLTLSTKF